MMKPKQPGNLLSAAISGGLGAKGGMVAGGVIGGFLGGPVGAILGAKIGAIGMGAHAARKGYQDKNDTIDRLKFVCMTTHPGRHRS